MGLFVPSVAHLSRTQRSARLTSNEYLGYFETEVPREKTDWNSACLLCFGWSLWGKSFGFLVRSAGILIGVRECKGEF